MMELEKGRPSKKKCYQIPKLRIIDLAADEVLSTGCKTPTSHPAGYPPGTATSCTVILCAAPDGS